MLFTIISHIQHKEKDGLFYAYAPYMREMNIWLKYAEDVEVVAPVLSQKKMSTELSYNQQKLVFTEIPAFDLLSVKNILRSFLSIPVISFRIWKAMKRSDHIHLRCPGNIGLLGCVMQVFFPKKPKTAKYAGNWDPKAKQPWSYTFQKWILRNPFLTRNMQVLVYGEWPEQSNNVKPFFTASFSEKVIPEVRAKNFEGNLTFLFVGNLVPGKHPLRAVQLVQELQGNLRRSQKAPDVLLQIYGDGPERDMLKAYCKNEGLQALVEFKGNRSLEELKEAYQQAHFVILPSQSEGWPKALAEGMFFGCIPIATPVSCLPWMLNFGKRGILIAEKEKRGERREERQNVEQETVERIIDLIQDPVAMKRMSMEAKEWSQQYTLERFEAAIKEVLSPQPPEINSGQAPKGK